MLSSSVEPLPAIGSAGGILLIWDTRVFTCNEAIGDERYIAVKGSWKGMMNKWQGSWCIFGDLNVVRCNYDRVNSQVNGKEVREFNDFINDMRLVEIPMGGRKFTRISDDGLKFSKMDRFLMNDDFSNLWGNMSVVALDRKLSDHCPIVLKDMDVDFGPKPFRVFNVWMEESDFTHVVEEAWKKGVRSVRPDCRFRDKLKNVKASLKTWSKERFGSHREKIDDLKKEAMWWELEAENKSLNDTERNVDPMVIKAEMARHYKKLFSEAGVTRPTFCCDRIEKISGEEAISLEKFFSEAEAWETIKSCGADKAPGPDGLNFKFIRKCWEIIKGDLMWAIKWFWVKMELSKGCNASFVTIIPKVADPIGRYILDGVLIANETMEFLKKKKEKGLIFKVDFQKAFDNINWRFLINIMERMGFGEKWRKLVEICLKSSSMSILVNGSPTEEFGLKRGVRQGDPLSPFLFIIAAEGLNAIVKEAVSLDIFRGVKVGGNNVTVAHLQYADDTIFFCKIYGIGVNESELKEMASWMGCGVGEFPFTYLGLSIGENMRRLLLLAGKGGLNIGSLRAKNLALFDKWWWRFKKEGGGLWVRVITSIHREGGGLWGNRIESGGVRRTGVWGDIMKVGEELEGLGVEFSDSFVGELGDGRDISFWIDRWVDNRRLCDRFPRLYHLDRRKEGSVFDKGSWLLGEDGEFKVKELSRLIEVKNLHGESGGQATVWNKLVPLKVNIFVWRALKGRLPVRMELDRRGIDLDWVFCPSCNNSVESCAHSLVTCDLAMSVWEKIFSWWKLGIVNAFTIDEFFSSYGNVNIPVGVSMKPVLSVCKGYKVVSFCASSAMSASPEFAVMLCCCLYWLQMWDLIFFV
ncbi:reverse transcriptase domain, reverse transcriptase zinc-binding domain protein [Tanacetum coccineum]